MNQTIPDQAAPGHRPTWDQYFMQLARTAATRSTCDRASVGCLIVQHHRVLVTGYNGAPSGLPHCDEDGHLFADPDRPDHCLRTLHAEQNALIQAALHGVSTNNGTAYVTHAPCLTCAKMLINAGIRRVVYNRMHGDVATSLEMMSQAGIEISQMVLSDR